MLPEIDSTNAEAARIAATLPGPAWILALRQTKGRGRRGRDWHDPEGNFAASYVTRPLGPPHDVALYSFVAALALHDALIAATARPDAFALKWPNDVLLHGGKLAGILLESHGHGALVGQLIIGIGVNLRGCPPADTTGFAPVSLMGELGLSLSPEDFLGLLAPAFHDWEERLAAHGFAPIREAWVARAARLGQAITARTVTETLEGVFEGIDPSGALQLRMSQGLRVIPAADVYFS